MDKEVNTQGKSEVTFDLDKISPEKLPELSKFRQKQLKAVEENPFVDIVDSKTFETAKKHRTTLVTCRTDLEKSKKAITSKINDFKKKVGIVTDELIQITKPLEDKQQSEVKRYEDLKEQERLEKERLERERVENHKNKISSFSDKWNTAINNLEYSGIKSTQKELDLQLKENENIDFEEFDVEYQTEVAIISERLKSKIAALDKEEEQRIESEKIRYENRILTFSSSWSETIDNLSFTSLDKQKSLFAKKVDELRKEFPDEYGDKIHSQYLKLSKRFDSMASFLQKQEDQRIQAEELAKKQRDILNNERKKIVEDLGFKYNPENDQLKGVLPYTENITSYIDWDFEEEDFQKYLSELKDNISKSKEELEKPIPEPIESNVVESDIREEREVIDEAFSDGPNLFDQSEREFMFPESNHNNSSFGSTIHHVPQTVDISEDILGAKNYISLIDMVVKNKFVSSHEPLNLLIDQFTQEILSLKNEYLEKTQALK